MQQDTALLVIDVQAGMFDPASPVHAGDQLLTTVGSLIDRARLAGVPVVYVQHNEEQEGGLVNGTPAWEVHAAIAPREGELTIQKQTPDSFHETPLQQELEARGIRRLILTGIQSEVCVDTTCRRAFSLGYEITLVEDGHSTWSSDELQAEQIILHHNSTLRWFAEVVPAAQVDFAK